MFSNLPEPIQDILGNPRYKFAILIILAFLSVFFIYSGDSAAETSMFSSLKSYLPELLATGIAVATLDEPTPVEVNIDMLAPF